MIERAKSVSYFIIRYSAAAVPSAIAALEMAHDVRERYEYGGSILAPVIGIFLSILFVMVGSSAGNGFANSLAQKDLLMTPLFLIILIGYGVGEWVVNPILPGKIASIFVVVGYIALPLSQIAVERSKVKFEANKAKLAVDAAAHQLTIAQLKLDKAKLEAETKDVRRSGSVPVVAETVSNGVSSVSETLETKKPQLTEAQVVILEAIVKGENTQQGIAAFTNRHKSTVSKTVKLLEEHGMILQNGKGIEPTEIGQSYLN